MYQHPLVVTIKFNRPRGAVWNMADKMNETQLHGKFNTRSSTIITCNEVYAHTQYDLSLSPNLTSTGGE
jgi:hypothetical protein